MDIDMFVKRAQDIVIAKCISDYPDIILGDGLSLVEIDVQKVLKGELNKGKTKIATIYPVYPSQRYLLTNNGGSVGDTKFLAIPELSVVKIPSHFNIKTIQGKRLRDQIKLIFSARHDLLRFELKELEKEKELLEKALLNKNP